MSDDSERIPECGSCGWATADLRFAEPSGRPDEGVWLCTVCASTAAGNAALYPMHHADDTDILSTIAWGINFLASRLAPNGYSSE